MKQCRVVTFVLIVGFLTCSTHAFAASLSGKKVAFASGGGTFPSTDTTLATAVIAKGKAKSVLDISLTVQTGTASDADLMCAWVMINGVKGEPMNPTSIYNSFGQDCPASTYCQLNGSVWLDLDAAEAANPGAFINQPLNVELHAYDCGNLSSDGAYGATLVVRMQKK